jgi:hypothetical protein
MPRLEARGEEPDRPVDRLPPGGSLDAPSRAQHGHARGEPVGRGQRDAADDAALQQLDHLHRDRPPSGRVADGELGERVGQAGRVEEDLDHALAGSHDPADPGREVVGKAMRFERVLDHGQGPSLELLSGRVQAIVHRRHREAQERGDVLLGAVVDVEERGHLAHRARQPGDGAEHGGDLLPILCPAVRRGPVGGHAESGLEGQGCLRSPPEGAVRLMAHDASEPAGEGGRIGEAAQPEPGGDEGLLDHVLRRLEIAQQGHGIAEGHVLEAPRDLRERVEVSLLGPLDQALHVHGVSPAIGASSGHRPLVARARSTGPRPRSGPGP